MGRRQKQQRTAGFFKVGIALILVLVSLAFNDNDSSFKAIPGTFGVLIGIYGIFQIAQSFRKYPS
jgi:uncharacterized membrane protein HdeD (DUF308 family)